MEKNVEMLSLADALRDGASLEDIRKSFEAALQDAQSEVAAEKKKAQEAKACEKCGDCDELDLDVCREEMIYAVLDYLTALGLIPEDTEIEEYYNIDRLIDMIKEVEEEHKAKIGFMKMLSAMAKMEADTKEKVSEKKVAEKSSADYVIAQFLKGLR